MLTEIIMLHTLGKYWTSWIIRSILLHCCFPLIGSFNYHLLLTCTYACWSNLDEAMLLNAFSIVHINLFNCFGLPTWFFPVFIENVTLSLLFYASVIVKLLQGEPWFDRWQIQPAQFGELKRESEFKWPFNCSTSSHHFQRLSKVHPK